MKAERATLPEKLAKTGARLVRHARRLVLRMAEVAVPRQLSAQIHRRVRRLPSVPARCSRSSVVMAGGLPWFRTTRTRCHGGCRTGRAPEALQRTKATGNACFMGVVLTEEASAAQTENPNTA